MNPDLLSAILDTDPQRVCDAIVACAANELKEARNQRKGVLEEHAPEAKGMFETNEEAVQHRERRDLFHLAGLFGATKRQLREDVEWLNRVNYLTDLETIEDAIADVIRRTEWPLANDLAVACVPKDWWDHCWTVAYRLVKEGLAEVPDAPGWLMWMPCGFSQLAGRGPQGWEDNVPIRGQYGYDVLQAEREQLMPCVEAFFRDPMAGRLASVYAGQMSGVGRDVPKPGTLKPHEWRSDSQNCIGMSLVGMTEQGDLEREYVADLFFTAMANVVNNKSGKWLGDLLNWVCNDEELVERERNANGRVTVSFLVGHENASVVKWALGRLTPLVKSGGYPLDEFAQAVMPALPTLAKGSAKKVIVLMTKRLAKNAAAALPVALAAAAGLLQSDAKVQVAALDAIEKSGAASHAEVRAALADADSVIQPSVRKRYDELLSAGGTVEAEPTEAPAMEPAPSAAGDLQPWPASFDPAKSIEPIEDIDTLIAEVSSCLAKPDSCLAVMRILDAMARFNGRLPEDIRDRLGSLRDGLGIEPGGFTLETLRREGWSKVVKVAKKNTEYWEFGPIADIGPVGSETYSEESERANFSNWWVFHQKGRGLEQIGADLRGRAFLRRLQVLMRAWLGIPVGSFRTRIDIDKARGEYERWSNEMGPFPYPFFEPPANPPITRWFNDILARIQAGEPFLILSTPTHAPWWVEPVAMVDRIARCEAEGLETSEIDAAMAILRLAPAGRDEALRAAKQLKSAAAAALRYALGGPKPRKRIGPELRACADHIRESPKYAATCAVGEFQRRSGHRYNPPVAGVAGVEVTVAPALDAGADASLLPTYVHYFHRTRLYNSWDGQPDDGAEPMLLEWLCSVMPRQLDLVVPYLVSIYTALGDSDSAYGRALDALLFSLFDGTHGPLPDSACFAAAYAMGLKRASARDHAADALIQALPCDGFDVAAVGRHLGDLLAWPLFTTNSPLKVIGVVAAEGGPVGRGLARLLEAALVRLAEPPRGTNKIVDVLTELRHAHPEPMSNELAAWCKAQPTKGAMGKAVEGLLATR